MYIILSFLSSCVLQALLQLNRFFCKHFNTFKGAPNSAAAEDRKKRRPEFVKPVRHLIVDQRLRYVLSDKFKESSIFPWSILNVSAPEHRNFYLKEILLSAEQSIEIAEQTLNQKSMQWHNERRKRITASRAYSLYTYDKNKNPDWNKKITKYINPAQITTKAMQYGTNTESLARVCYEQQERCSVLQFGFLVNPHAPWLGYSPDGFVNEKDKIIEIKCPILGETCSLSDVLPSLKYLTDSFALKQKSDYYCQIQIGMAVFNCKSCDFIIYSLFENACFVLDIQFDLKYFLDVILILEKIYFKYMLPILSQK